jgi:hypothetical protein
MAPRPSSRAKKLATPLLAVDGDSFAHRSYHALSKSILRNGGRPAGAILDFANMLLKLYREEKKQCGKCIVASGDRDTFQLATESTTILFPIRAGEVARIGPAEVREKYGVDPAQVARLYRLGVATPPTVCPEFRALGRSLPLPCCRPMAALKRCSALGGMRTGPKSSGCSDRSRPWIVARRYPSFETRRRGESGCTCARMEP